MKPIRISPLALLAFVSIAPTSQAAVIAGYDFETASPLVATVKDSNVIAGDFGQGSGLSTTLIQPVGDNTGLDADGVAFGTTTATNTFRVTRAGGVATNSGVAAAITANDYIGFAVTPSSGFEMDLSSFTFKGALRFSNSPEKWNLYSSIDGFTTSDEIAAGTLTTHVKTGTTTEIAGAFESVTVPLSGSQFQDITAATEFRLYLWGSPANNSAATRYDKIVLNGSVVAVPEPSSAGLVALGVLGTCARRRRQG